MYEDDLAVFCLGYESLRRAGIVELGLNELNSESIFQIQESIPSDPFTKARRELTRLAELGVRVIPILSQRYPTLLRQINGPPAILFLRGELKELTPTIAIVGSRNASRDALEFARSIARQITESGGCVVSGLAYGCDASAHHGALSASGAYPGIAVLGGGVLNIYPSEHQTLAEELVTKGGALISECHPNDSPRKGSFPARNRIISGLSVATIVVEANDRSGSLITSRFSAEQGREVFAVPGSVHSPRSRGTNGLIRDGARILTSIEDLSEFVPHLAAPKRSDLIDESKKHPLLALLNERALSFDELCEAAKIPASELFAQISLLELEGRLHCEDGLVYASRN